MIALASINNEHYQKLADITVGKNKLVYCAKHGYFPHFKRDGWKNKIDAGFQSKTHALGFEKIQTILDIFESRADIDWVWFTDCDSMITNMNINLESLIKTYKKSFHSTILLSEDGNGINVGSMLVNRSDKTIAYLKFILSKQQAYKDKPWNEQQVIIDTHKDAEWEGLVEVLPQKMLNAYDYNDYEAHQYTKPLEEAKLNGQWSKGDLLIHWPGKSLDQRMILAEKYLKEVIK